jgi:acetyltransferase-like isoleucine patch superfamily enzyme
MLGRLYHAARTLAPIVRPLRAWLGNVRFQLWTKKLDLELRRKGGRLILDAPHGARLADFPRIRALHDGSGDATFTLRLGKDVSFGKDMTFEVWAGGTSVLEIGDHGMFNGSSLLQLHAGKILMADHAQIREWVILKSSGELVLESRALISYWTSVHCAERVELAALVGIGERVTIVDSDHTLDGTDEHFLERPVKITPVRVGKNTFVGSGSLITRGARTGCNSAVAGGSVVLAGDYPDGWLLAGIPAKPFKPLAELAKKPTAA